MTININARVYEFWTQEHVLACLEITIILAVNKDKYEKVRRSDRYNMAMEADKVIKACSISSREYRDIILSYGTYKRYVKVGYGTVNSFMRRYKK